MGVSAKVLPDNILKLMSPEDRKPMGKAGLTAREAIEKWQRWEELKIHRELVNWLNSHADIFTYIHARTDKRSTIKNGLADFHVMRHGKVVAIELKGPGGVLSSAQEKQFELYRETGISAYVCYSFQEAVMRINQHLGPPNIGRF